MGRRLMLWYRDRRKVANNYTEWRIENGVADTPESVVAYMQIKGWLNEDKILKDLGEPNWVIVYREKDNVLNRNADHAEREVE